MTETPKHVKDAIAAIIREAIPDEHETDWREMVCAAVRNARPHPGETRVRWGCVADALGVGSTRAAALCREFGLDPDEKLVGPEED